jgi:hypothetical protein
MMVPMSRIVSAVVLMGAGLCAVPAAAQAPVSVAPASSSSRVSIGAIGGVGGAGKTSGLAGGELAFRLTDRIEVFGEGVGMRDLVTQPRRDLAARIGNVLAVSQGRAVATSISVPTFYGGGGVRLMLTRAGGVRPYVTGGGGMARLTIKPVFLLGGADVTANLSQYGVTLGNDLTGTVTKAAVSAGAGVRANRGRWYVDGGVRVLTIRTDPEAINFIGAAVGLGARF